MSIRCFYNCDLCKLDKQYVEVPERDPSTHGIVQWIQLVAMPAFAGDHAKKSPLCRAQALSIAIPFDDATEHLGTKSSS